MAMRLIVSSLSFALVWYSERERMVTSPDCIGLSVVISLLILARKDTIKACIYVKELVRFMLWKVEEGVNTNNSNNTNGADVKSAKGVEIYNCCFEPAYTIQHIVEAMKKVTGLTQFVPDIPNWVIMPMARTAMLLGSPMGICPARVKKLQISTNICGEKLKNCGYQFKWSFEEALADWFEDNDRKYLK